MMTKRQRMETVLAGQRPDRPPVGFWYHFPIEQITGTAAVDAHLDHFETYDLDFLKIMNDHRFPRGAVDIVRSTADLAKIKPLSADAGDLGKQLEVIAALRAKLGAEVFTCTTQFNPWTVLRYLTREPSDIHKPPRLKAMDERDEIIARMLAEDRPAVQGALEAITETIAAFMKACLEAGADGMFLSVRDDWVDSKANGPGTYDALVKPLDLKILEVARDYPFNFLHICGEPLDFKRFAEYPVQVLHWADRVTGPSIAYARDRVKPVIAGGVDNLTTLPEGTPEDCAGEVRDALRQAKDRPIIIAPGCTFDPALVPAENLRAMVEAARRGYDAA